ncbi:MAG: DUF819 family protein, partial [Oricola sp.]|nr:DUF819 family protein [Oricola sp.]
MDTDALIQAPIGVLAVLLVCVVAAERLARLPALRKFGAALLVIVIAAVLANLRIIPPVASSNPVYEFIFSYVISGSIFLLLLQVNLGALKRAGSQMLGAFALGALGVCAGALLAAAIVPFGDLIGDNNGALAGMFAGTYIGGSANFNAVAEVMEVTRESGLYTAATVVDNVMTDIWILVTLALSALLVRTPWFKKAVAPAAPAPEEKAHADDAAPLSVMDVALPLALAALALWASSVLSGWLEARGITIPSILFVTTLALM